MAVVPTHLLNKLPEVKPPAVTLSVPGATPDTPRVKPLAEPETFRKPFTMLRPPLPTNLPPRNLV